MGALVSLIHGHPPAPRDCIGARWGCRVLDGLDEQRSLEVGFQQVRGRRQAGRVYPCIGETRDVESYAKGRFFDPHARRTRGAATVKRARHAQHAR